MTTTSLSTRLDQVLRIADQQGQTHTLERSNDTFLIDGHVATVSITGAEVQLATAAGTICVTAQAFWHAFSGAEPTASEAGLLLADSLMRWQVLQQMRQAQAIFQQACEPLQTLGMIPLPTYRLSPFIQQALDAFDGTAETTLLLAKVLREDPATITAWAVSLGKVPTPMTLLTKETQNGQPVQELTKPEKTGNVEATHQGEQMAEKPAGETPARLQWTAEMDAQLISAFEASCAESIKDTIAEIAKRFDWPLNSVHGRVYKLKLNEKKRTPTQQHDREPEDSQEGD